jgi:hypothetical protein
MRVNIDLIDRFLPDLWVHDGALDAAGSVLMLDAEGGKGHGRIPGT